MNSRSSVNETNLVNLSADLTTLNQLDAKEPLLSFPFDHIYACHAESSDRRETLQTDKEVEISTQCLVTEDKAHNDRLSALENQNKRLKDLLIYNLDLIQQQNDLITKKEKVYQSLKQENDTLRLKLNNTDKKVTVCQKPNININPPPLVPPPNVTSTVVKKEPSSSQIMLNSFTELLLPDNTSNPFIFNSDIDKTKHFGQDAFDLTRSSETDVASYFTTDLGVRSILNSTITTTDTIKMIDNKRSLIKKDLKTETRPEPMYTVTSNSGNPVIQKIQRNRKRASGIGSLSRMTKNPKVQIPQTSISFNDDKNSERTFSVNKKSKMINTYGKSRNAIPKKGIMFTGSLSDRLQLIDTTPTGEDPYQIGEAEMREQSPIPKLMLQKTNHGRMKICTDTMGASTSTTTTRIYDSPVTDTKTKPASKIKFNRFNLPCTYTRTAELSKEPPKTMIAAEPDINVIKAKSKNEWQMYSTKKPGNETSLCDFSYGENTNNLTSHILPLDDFPDFFEPAPPMNISCLHSVEYSPAAEKLVGDKFKKRGARTASLGGPNIGEETVNSKRGTESKRGRKRALSTTGLMKPMKRETPQKVEVAPKTKLIKEKAACRETDPLPGMVTNQPYHTLMGDPDLSWYLGLDQDLKFDDIDQFGNDNISTVEVPRWREMPYSSCYTFEGTENLDDKVFEKRHQKLEAEERRQLRWHMRRIREQRHLERLRQRQRDPWWSGNPTTTYQRRPVYTIWPNPQRDLEAIEITDTIPVLAFGDIVPELPHADFMLPWVRTSKAQKRSKRSKTLH